MSQAWERGWKIDNEVWSFHSKVVIGDPDMDASTFADEPWQF